MKYCSKCGAEIKEGNDFCPKCGKSLNGKSKVKLKNPKLFIGIGGSIIVIIAIILIFNVAGKDALHKHIMGDWYRYETGNRGSTYKLEMNFDEDEFEYKFVSSYSFLNTTILNEEYKVVGRNKIEVKDKVYTITFDDDTMTITPALTSTDSSESWTYDK